MKKITSFVLLMVMCLSYAFSVTAAEQERVNIVVNHEDEIIDFYNSSEYNPEVRYSFTYPAKVQPRISCPKCGYNTYKGYIKEYEGNVLTKECPTGLSMESDILVEVTTYSYSACTTCGYETKKYPQGTKWHVTCSLSPVTFWARPGQTVEQGYDLHECYSSWGL